MASRGHLHRQCKHYGSSMGQQWKVKTMTWKLHEYKHKVESEMKLLHALVDNGKKNGSPLPISISQQAIASQIRRIIRIHQRFKRHSGFNNQLIIDKLNDVLVVTLNGPV